MALIATLVACGAPTAPKSKRGEPLPARHDADAVHGFKPFDEPLDGAELRASPLASKDLKSAELMLALAACDCAPHLLSGVARAITTAKGVLPQALMPAIREQIRSDEDLQSLLSLPLGGVLADLFTDEGEVVQKIRAGLAQKVSRFTPGGSRLGEVLPLRFDGFLGSDAGTAGTRATTIESEAARWLLVLSNPGVWTKDDAMAFSDHGWQVFETMRLMVEWKYALGLEANAEGGVFGGITIDPKNPRGGLSAFDPRKGGAPRILSGEFSATFEGETTLEMALSGNERWLRKDRPITLREQALVWAASAHAFKRLRADRREHVAGLFGEGDALFPRDAHQLPLAFLPGMQVLLEDELIDRDARIVRSAVGSPVHAGLLDLVRFASGVGHWSAALSDIDAAGLDQETTDRLRDAPKDMLPAVQVAVQSLLRNIGDAEGESYGFPLKAASASMGDTFATPAEAGEFLVTMLRLEGELLKSPLLEEKIRGVFHWYAAHLLRPALQGSGEPWSPRDVLWGYAAVAALKAYAADGDLEMPWLEAAESALSRAVSALSPGGAAP